MRVRFGDCVLDSETRELSRAGARVHLSPKAFDLLGLLLELRPKAIPKSEVHRRLWPGTFVSDGTLTSLVAEVRSAIGDTRGARLIRTVQRFGYAFSGEAESTGPGVRATQFAHRLFGRHGKEIALEEGETVLGRDRQSTIFLDSGRVSRRHARIRIDGEQATIEDLESSNGTTVRGDRISAPEPIRDGDVIGLGGIELTYRIFPLSGSTEAESPARSRPAGSPRRKSPIRRGWR